MTDLLIDSSTLIADLKAQDSLDEHLDEHTALKLEQPIFSLEDIQKCLPHRYPFLLVDRVINYVPGKRAVGIKNVTINEPHFQGHFPQRPIMPGVLIIEAMAQVCGIALSSLIEENNRYFLFTGINKVRFRQQVVPGDQLVMSAELLSVRGLQFAKMKARAQVEGKLAAEGELSFALEVQSKG